MDADAECNCCASPHHPYLVKKAGNVEGGGVRSPYRDLVNPQPLYLQVWDCRSLEKDVTFHSRLTYSSQVHVPSHALVIYTCFRDKYHIFLPKWRAYPEERMKVGHPEAKPASW